MIKWFKDLFKKKGQSSDGSPINPKQSDKTVEDKIDEVVSDYIQNCRSLLKINSSVTHWQDFIKALAYAESGFNLTCRYVEPPPLGKDVVTGKQNTSEGLTQMSYQDSKYHGCNFDWSADKTKADGDPTKTIFSIVNNIECCLIVLDKLVAKKGQVFFNDGHYWAVLKPNNKRHGVFLNKLKGYQSSRKPLEINVETKTPWLEIAKKELGQKEISGSSDNARIVEYHSATTLKATDDETPWCSSFVSWCLEKSGIVSTKNAWARSYLNWGKKITDPVEGCVVVFSRGDSSGHVAFFIKDHGNEIEVLGGNQSNKVCYDRYPKSRLLGYRMPSV